MPDAPSPSLAGRRVVGPRKITAELRARIVARRGDGLTVVQLAAEFGLHKTTVSRALRVSGVDTSRAKLSEADLVRARELMDAGESVAELARRFRVAYSTMWMAMRRA